METELNNKLVTHLKEEFEDSEDYKIIIDFIKEIQRNNKEDDTLEDSLLRDIKGIIK